MYGSWGVSSLALTAVFAAFFGAALSVADTSPARADAADYSTDSKANSWGLVGEQKARFSAKVVDILCELSGDCPADCGAGARQIGLLRQADNKLIPVNKNIQTVFSGAVDDLLPYCGEMVEVDGLMVGEDIPAQYYQVQLIRRAVDDKFVKTNQFTKVWNRENPELAKAKGPWFRKDPRVNARIEAEGRLGLGLETDAAFVEEWF